MNYGSVTREMVQVPILVKCISGMKSNTSTDPEMCRILCSVILHRLRRRWEDNIKMDLQEVGGGCEDWMELAQDRDRWRALVSAVMNLQVPKMRGIS